jgi:hypothetical protein
VCVYVFDCSFVRSFVRLFSTAQSSNEIVIGAQVLEILAIPLEVTPSTTGGPDKAANSTLRDLMNECYSFLIAFCDGSEENQAECYWELPLLITHLSVEGLKASECVSAIFKDNEGLCSKVSEKLVRKFLGVIVKHGKSSKWLKVLLSFVEVSGRTIERTQGLVLKLMQDEAEIILELDGNQGGGEGDAAETLAREGNETRWDLAMIRRGIHIPKPLTPYAKRGIPTPRGQCLDSPDTLGCDVNHLKRDVEMKSSTPSPLLLFADSLNSKSGMS